MRLKTTPPGLILLRKPVGISSFAALTPIKHHLGGRVGHCGSLDPFAHGLLVVLCGVMTKATPYLMALRKHYVATICFGATTDTLDRDGQIHGEAPLPTRAHIAQALPRCVGTQQQTPPQFSAVKVGGKRAYAQARAGQYVDIPPRHITIYSIEQGDYDPPYLTISISCSAGTYIRVLAADIARMCGSLGYLSYLERTAIGNFTLSSATDGDQFDCHRDLIAPAHLPALDARFHTCAVEHNDAARILRGHDITHLDIYPKIMAVWQPDSHMVLLMHGERFVAACRIEDGAPRYVCVNP